MIGDKTVVEFLFQFIVMVQPMIWIILYNSDIYLKYQQERIIKYGFFFLMEGTLFAIIIKKFSVGFYTTSILAQYVVMITASFYLFTQRKHVKEAICLAFLTVFLNSFYWELPLHILEIVQVGFHSGMLVQFWRLLPLAFFLKRFTFKKNQTILIIGGQMFAVLMILLRYTIRPTGNISIYFFTRLICMAILTKAIIEAQPINSDRTTNKHG